MPGTGAVRRAGQARGGRAGAVVVAVRAEWGAARTSAAYREGSLRRLRVRVANVTACSMDSARSEASGSRSASYTAWGPGRRGKGRGGQAAARMSPPSAPELGTYRGAARASPAEGLARVVLRAPSTTALPRLPSLRTLTALLPACTPPHRPLIPPLNPGPSPSRPPAGAPAGPPPPRPRPTAAASRAPARRPGPAAAAAAPAAGVAARRALTCMITWHGMAGEPGECTDSLLENFSRLCRP